MPNVIFARPRWEYGSYVDLYTLIELSGYPLIYVDEIDAQSDNTYIYTVDNGETLDGWPDARARVIHWQFEWDFESPCRPGVSERWTSDAWFAGKTGARFVPLGSHAGLKAGCDTPERDYDTVMLGYNVPRRGTILTQLQDRGLRLPLRDGRQLLTSAWGDERHRVLSRSRSMLHVHQWDDIPTIAPLRVALAAAYSLPLIMEAPADKTPLNYSTALCSDYANLADFTAMWTRRNEARILEDYGRGLHNLLCRDKTFRVNVEAAL